VNGPAHHPLRTRVLHWLTALLVFTALLVGFVMVNSLGSYAALLSLHMTLGIAILLIVVARVANRFTHRAPPLPETVGPVERKLIFGSEVSLYALLLVQPLVGWAMVSSAGRPVIIFNRWPVPGIAPFDAHSYFLLRQTHSILAYLLVIVIAAHVSAVLLHTLTLRDGMLSRMTHQGRRGPSLAESGQPPSQRS
jgi:cytochrome b561